MFYATFLLPEALAYPVFAAVAYLCVRSLAGGGRRWTIAAIVGCLVATQVRGELATLAAAYALAAAVVLRGRADEQAAARRLERARPRRRSASRARRARRR